VGSLRRRVTGTARGASYRGLRTCMPRKKIRTMCVMGPSFHRACQTPYHGAWYAYPARRGAAAPITKCSNFIRTRPQNKTGKIFGKDNGKKRLHTFFPRRTCSFFFLARKIYIYVFLISGNYNHFLLGATLCESGARAPVLCALTATRTRQTAWRSTSCVRGSCWCNKCLGTLAILHALLFLVLRGPLKC
jgi:hypothetical protein